MITASINPTEEFATQLNQIVTANIETQKKIARAVAAAKAAKKQADEEFELAKAANNRLVSELQKKLAEIEKEKRASVEETYRKTMCELGLSADVYPLETAIMAVDSRAITPAIENIGLGVRKIANLGKGIGARFMSGFNKK